MDALSNSRPPLFDRRFEDLAGTERARIFGVDYARLNPEAGGELFVTREGWSRGPGLLPERWFVDRRYLDEGQRLTGGTGHVYCVPSPTPTKPNLNLVVKFSRSGQDVPLHVTGTFPEDMSEEEVRAARWNSPFEEFGLLHDLRNGRFGPPGLRIRTKRPLAIYCPPNQHQSWQLGRSSTLWRRMESALQHAQQIAEGDPVHLHASRLYIMIFEWVNGDNSVQCCEHGLLDEAELKKLTRRVAGEMNAKGFRVLDNKPSHIILRVRNNDLIRRNGEPVYAIVDFELLKRSPRYEAWLRTGGGI